jgi:sensor histidine kinase YesM
MGDRLQTVWDVPAALQAHPFAPLLLQPLLENAIKYGLEPKIEGGTITVKARELDGRITITVEDDGLGLGQPSSARKSSPTGAGTGLKNIEARLRSTFGTDATLTLRNLTAGATGSIAGCCATMSFADHRPRA